MAVERSEFKWPLKPKHHWTMDLCRKTQKSRRNPKYTSCMLDEDMLGKVIRLAKEVNRKCVCDHIIWRYRLRLTRC